MPFIRPTLTDLSRQIAQDMAVAQPGADATLRFSNLSILGRAQAGLAYQHYGYLDWIAKQSTPFTATDEFLEAWAALKKVYRKAATSASGQATFTAVNGTLIPSGTTLVRGDGVKYTTTNDATAGSNGQVVVSASTVPDPAGLTGAFGNAATGTVLTLGTAIGGAQSNGTVTMAFVGGADLETDATLRGRMLAAYQETPQGGNADDYIQWATAVPGVTRAWCTRNGYGPGTVVVYIMLDAVESAFNGFPQGNNGVATDETRGTPTATGDQLTVANALYAEQPVEALVYVVGPTANAVNFTLKGIPAANQSAALAAIADVFLREGKPGGTIILAHIWTAIAAVAGVNDFLIVSPTVDIVSPTGALPTVGTPTWQ